MNIVLPLLEEIIKHYPEGRAFVTKTVEELLFKGYYLPFIEDVASFLIMNLTLSEEFVQDMLSQLLPPDMWDFHFAFYRDIARNGTVDGPYLVGTGEDDPSDFGRIHLWHGESMHYMEPWSSEECNAINGTDGTVFPPFVDTETLLYTFVTD
ncbi:unnamed protein product, partial [Darwinula stevensoni]